MNIRNRLIFASAAALSVAALAASGCGEDVLFTSSGASASAGAGAGSGSSTQAGSGGGAPASDLPCDIADFVRDRCQECHSSPAQFGAPMPLTTRADLMAPALDGTSTVASVMLARMQADERMPPPPREAATSDEIALVQGWIDAGMPARADGEMCGSTGTGGMGAGGGPPASCEPDLSLAGQTPFEMPQSSVDEQVCFGIDVPASNAKRHITAIMPKIDNSTIIHHILLMQAPSSVSPEPAPCAFTNLNWKLLYAWGPGTPAHHLPPEAGFPIEAGDTTHFVLQVHYNNLQGLSGELDQSGVDLCTTEELRTHDADVMALGTTTLNIPPQSTKTTTCTTNILDVLGLGTFFPVTAFQAWPHMHQIGTGMKTTITRPGSGPTTMVDVPDYDFDYQITYPINEIVNIGDSITTSCTHTNTSSNNVGFGENTADEMCFNFVSYYPRINAAQWHWLLPSYTATCQ